MRITSSTRIDYTVSSKNNLYGHFFKDNYERISSPGNLDYVPESNVADIRNYGITDTHTFSPTFLNELTVSYLDTDSFRTATERVPPRDMGINIDEGYLGVGMSINVGNGQMNLSFTGPERQVYRNLHWKDTMTLVRSAHTFKWGYEGQYVNFDLIRGNGARSATFTGLRSGSAFSDFMLGAFDQVSHGFGAADSFPILWKHQFFIQDEWKLTPRITMNVGLRYEPWFPWEQEYGRYTSWEYGTQSTVKPDAPRGILFPGDPNVPFKTVENDFNNFAPRLGRGVGRQRQWPDRRARRIWHLLQPHQRHVRACRRGAVDRHRSSCGTAGSRIRTRRSTRPCRLRACRSRASSAACRSAHIQGSIARCIRCRSTSSTTISRWRRRPCTTSTSRSSASSRTTSWSTWRMSAGSASSSRGTATSTPPQFKNSPRTGAPPNAQNIIDRVIYEPGHHRTNVARARDAVPQLVQRRSSSKAPSA